MCSIFHSSIHFSDLGFVQYEVDGRFTVKIGDMTMPYQLLTWNGCMFVHTRDRRYFKLNVLKANSNCERFKRLL